MKLSMAVVFLFGSLMFSLNSYSASEVQSVVETKQSKESSSKKKRRKKVMMCHECGKAETECDCEGEGHGVEEDHSDH